MHREEGSVAGRIMTALLVLAVLVGLVLFAGRVVQKKQSGVRTFAGAPHHLVVNIEVGTVTIVGRPGDDTTIHRTIAYGFRKPKPRERVEPDAVHIDGTCPKYSLASCQLSYRIEVPTDDIVEVHTSAGSLKATSLTGSVTMATSAGSLTVDDLEGRVDLSTKAGSITGTALRTLDASAATDAGTVSLRFEVAPNIVDVSTAAGNVLVDVVDAVYKVDATTSVGSRRVDVGTDPDATRSVKVHSGAGSVRVAKHSGTR